MPRHVQVNNIDHKDLRVDTRRSAALGDDVNIAFRIEGLTRLVDQPILVSAAFAEGFSGAPLRSCGRHAVKGVEKPVEVFATADEGGR